MEILECVKLNLVSIPVCTAMILWGSAYQS
jgi:hypothetical protein